MKFSEKEIIGGGILLIVIVALLFNVFWASPDNVGFCGDGSCSVGEIGSCGLDCDWCGDSYCQVGESCSECSEDCGVCGSDSFCGDGACNIGECGSGCWKDCSFLECENGVCELEKGENCVDTPNDCKCSDGYCDKGAKQCAYQSCGNNICESHESFLNCPNDCKGEAYNPKDTSDINYPIIFVHGHSVTEGKSRDSINAFREFQEKMTSEGYVESKGIVLPKGTKISFGAWGKIDKPIVVRTTYYLNAYDEYGTSIGPEDNQQIPVYSRRLGNVVDEVLKITGKNKVILVAHSMGGLVAREYVKNQGGLNKVDKLVTIGTPNGGIYVDVSNNCEGIFGRGVSSSPECDDMKAGSTFLNNLNSEDETPGDIGYMTIAGRATSGSVWVLPLPVPYKVCSSSIEYHDEVICSSSVRLSGSVNNEVKGWEVEGKGTFHNIMLSPSKVSEVYNLVVDFLF